MIDSILKWLATSVLIIGTIANSAGYFPLGPIILIVGGLVWLVVSIRWREPSLIATNLAMTVAAIAGLTWHYFGHG
jgi:hypothetical protein